MKKSLAVLFGFISIGALAASNVSSAPKQNANENAPRLKLAVYDISGKVPKDIGQTYSLSKKNQILCWTAFNMPFSPTNQNHVTQIITAPNNKAKFISQGASITVSPDGKTSTIVSVEPSYNNEFVQLCWVMENTDPRGKYKMDIQVNDIKFGPASYEVVK